MKIIKSQHSTTTWYIFTAQMLIWEKIFSLGDKISKLVKEGKE